LKVKKIVSIASVVVILALLIYGVYLYRAIFSVNTTFSETEFYVHIPSESNYEEVKAIISPFIKNMEHFEMIAKAGGDTFYVGVEFDEDSS
jgi:UPF0755 protein